MKSVITVLALASGLILGSCEDLSLLLESIDDEVKQANGRYLQVENTRPVQNDADINPSVPILITFDRPVDADKLADGDWIKIRIEDSLLNLQDFKSDLGGELVLKFNELDNTLSLTPKPFLTGGTKIIVTLEGNLPATDGSVLRDTETWSFRTGKLPAGNISIDEGSGPALEGYINAAGSYDVSVDFSREVTDYYVSTIHVPEISEDPILTTTDSGTIGTDWNDVSASTPPVTTSVTISPGDGVKTIYARFYDFDEDAFSPIVEAATILDTEDPTVNPYFKGSRRTNRWANVYAGASDNTGIQDGEFSWSSFSSLPPNTQLDFSSDTEESTSVALINSITKEEAEEEADIFLQATALDFAGNSDSGVTSLPLIWDNYVAAPDVFLKPDPEVKEDDFIRDELRISVDPAWHAVSEPFLEDPDKLGAGWEVSGTEIPNEDLAGFVLQINGYKHSGLFRDFDFDEGTKTWFSEYLAPFRYYRGTEKLQSGYYEFDFFLVDDLENLSDAGTNYVTYITDQFAVTYKRAQQREWDAILPHRLEDVTRYPSFAWPVVEPLGDWIGAYGEDFVYYVLKIGDPDGDYQMVVTPDINVNGWLHTGPSALQRLPAGKEITWWFEIWGDEERNGPEPDTKNDALLYQSFKEDPFGALFIFRTGEY